MVWVSIVKIVVVPLVVAYFLVAVVSIPSGREAGRLGAVTMSTHTLIAFGGLAFALLVAKFLIPLSGASVEAVRPQLDRLVLPEASNGTGEALSIWEAVLSQVWTNPLTAVVKVQILPILIWTLLLSMVLRRMAPRMCDPVIRLFRAVIRVGRFVFVGLLLFMPLVVFGFCFKFVAQLGFDIVGAIGFYIALICVVSLSIVVVLYLSMPVFTDISVRRFAGAVLPSQLVALGSRSSMACLPSLIEAAEKDLRLSPKTVEFVLPLSVSSFKLSRAVTTPVKFFFFAHLFSVNLDPGAVAVFIMAEFALSYGTPGMPSGSIMLMMPVYLAAGIPIEAYLLTKAVDTIPDIAKTILNVTEDLALDGIVDRMVKGSKSVVASSGLATE
jgi:Na+/H+-dicarboxylate symporter